MVKIGCEGFSAAQDDWMDYYRTPQSVEAAAAAKMCLIRLAALVQDSTAMDIQGLDGAAGDGSRQQSQDGPLNSQRSKRPSPHHWQSSSQQVGQRPSLHAECTRVTIISVCDTSMSVL